MRHPIGFLLLFATLLTQAQPYFPITPSWEFVTYNIFGEERIGAMAWAPDGKVAMCGSYLQNSPFGDQVFYARLDTTGIMDPTFDGDGFVAYNVCTTTERCTDMVVLPDGRMLGVGYEDFTGAPDQLFVHRINADGSMDSTFAVDGEFLLMLNGYTHGMSIGLQSDGRIIVAGWDGNWESFVMRLLPDGELDTSFGDNGYRFLPQSLGDLNETRKLVVLPDDGIAVVGYYFIMATTERNSYVWRLDADGNDVTGFGQNGVVLIPCQNGGCDNLQQIAVWPNGDLQLAGHWNIWPNTGSMQGSAFLRLTSTGQPVSNWGTNGRVRQPMYVESITAPIMAIHPLPDGRLLALPQRLDHALIALLPDGSPDLSFGPNGRWTTTVPFFTPFMQHDMVVTGDGSTVIIGSGIGITNSLLLTRVFLPQLTTGEPPRIIAANDAPMLLGNLAHDHGLLLKWPASFFGKASIELYTHEGRYLGTPWRGEPKALETIRLELPGNLSPAGYFLRVIGEYGTHCLRFVR